MQDKRPLTPSDDAEAQRNGVSCVIPALNEQGAIAATCKAVSDVFQSRGISWELIVVDDGSTDDTAAIAHAHGARVLSHPMNAGYGRSLKSGIDAARYDTIIITDADGSYPVERMPDLIEAYSSTGVCMVIGRRQGSAYRESFLKNMLRYILKGIVEFVSGRHVPDVNSGFRIFSRSTIRRYYPRLCDTFSFTSSLTLAYLMSGRFVAFMPIQYNDRIGMTKVRLWRDSLRSLQYVFQQAIYYNPLKIFFSLAALCEVLSVLFLAIGISGGITTAFALAAGCFLVGLVVVAIGILGELLKLIMEQGGIQPDSVHERIGDHPGASPYLGEKKKAVVSETQSQ